MAKTKKEKIRAKFEKIVNEILEDEFILEMLKNEDDLFKLYGPVAAILNYIAPLLAKELDKRGLTD